MGTKATDWFVVIELVACGNPRTPTDNTPLNNAGDTPLQYTLLEV